ncbi:MAG TPA: hypothetical protein VMT45_16170 [Thermoanaerobaculaceae bacterium]|nr:hypothetical protein [Thermoanaerobaculaceae bacterium]
MKKLILLSVVLAMAAAGSAMAQAVVSETEREAVRGVPDKWGVALGSFWQTFDTTVRLDGQTRTGTDINWEHDLGMDKNRTDFELALFYRLGDRHRIDVIYTAWNRSHSKTLDRDIQWGDTIYHAHASLDSSLDTKLFNIIYKYAFFNNGKVNFGLNGGISSLWLDFKLSGQASVSGSPVSGRVVESKSQILPIPVIGAHFEMTLLKRLFWRAEGNFFAASIAGYNGNLTILNTSLDYYFTRNVGLGGGFASNVFKVTTSGSRGGDLFVRYSFSGVYAHLDLAF